MPFPEIVEQSVKMNHSEFANETIAYKTEKNIKPLFKNSTQKNMTLLKHSNGLT